MKLKLILTAIVAILIASAVVMAGSVTITPDQPTTSDALTCKVTGSSATYNFYWYKDATQYSTKTGTSSAIPSSATNTGEKWICKVFTPSSGYLPEMYIGEATKTVKADAPVIVKSLCEDGLDNDGDGLVDMDDPGCSNPEDDDEYNAPDPVYQCSDGIDNDNDGLVDMQDPGCSGPTDNSEYNMPLRQCIDGIDNDGDGLIDMNDPGCTSWLDNNEYNEPQPTYQCSDGLDNDNDGLVDMQDPGCTSTTDNNEYNEPQPTYQCSDGIDNDNDGLVDMQDPGCESTTDNNESDDPVTDDLCSIEKVWINGNLMDDIRLEVELGEDLDVEVKIKCGDIDSEKELRLVGSIWTGEYEDVQDETGLFIVKPGVTYFKSMTLTIPQVMDTENNKLRLMLVDGQEAEKTDYNLYVKEQRHNIVVQDILTNQAKAGETLFIKVRAENQGYKAEEDIKVTASFLGITASTYIDELESFGNDDTRTANLFISIPENTPDGLYELEITLKYGKEKTVETRLIHVTGGTAATASDDETLASISQLPEEVTVGKESQVKVMIVNLNDETKAYGVHVTADWATVDQEQLVTIEAGKSAEIIVKILPEETGIQDFRIDVTANDEVIAEYSAKIEVKNPSRAYGAIFGSLAGIILVVGLILTIRSVQRKPKETSFY
ncbi:MAG: hypothetical protein ABIH53_02700 [archaeon]